MMTFQSRFGREPRLTPYTDETLKMLGEKGTKHIQCCARALPPIVSKRWKRSPSRTGKFSSKRVASNMNIFRRLMLTRRILK